MQKQNQIQIQVFLIKDLGWTKTAAKDFAANKQKAIEQTLDRIKNLEELYKLLQKEEEE